MIKSLYNYISIEGNIGAGKTTLATKIAIEQNARLILERFEDNPFLPGFYQDPARYAFPVELSFVADRYQQLKEDLSAPDLFKSFTVSDYFLQKCLIFSKNNLNEDEFFLFTKLFSIINESLPKPDLIIYLYLESDQLKKNILKRGREYEMSITTDYLESIQAGYMNFLLRQKEQKVLIIDISNIDFVGDQEHYQFILSLLTKEHPVGVSRIIR